MRTPIKMFYKRKCALYVSAAITDHKIRKRIEIQIMDKENRCLGCCVNTGSWIRRASESLTPSFSDCVREVVPVWRRCWLAPSWWSPRSGLSPCRCGWSPLAATAALCCSCKKASHCKSKSFQAATSGLRLLPIGVNLRAFTPHWLTWPPPPACCAVPPPERRSSPNTGLPAGWRARRSGTDAGSPSVKKKKKRDENFKTKFRCDISHLHYSQCIIKSQLWAVSRADLILGFTWIECKTIKISVFKEYMQ